MGRAVGRRYRAVVRLDVDIEVAAIDGEDCVARLPGDGDDGSREAGSGGMGVPVIGTGS